MNEINVSNNQIQKNAVQTVRTFANWFQKYTPEKVLTETKLEVKEDATLKQLKKTFMAFCGDGFALGTTGESYRYALKFVQQLKYTPEDITSFSVYLSEIFAEFKGQNFDEKVGLFLSALINSSEDIEFLLITEQLTGSAKIRRLGYCNTKRIIVKGDVGAFVGEGMIDGIIVIQGSVDGGIGGGIEGGAIFVTGDVGELNAANKIKVKVDGTKYTKFEPKLNEEEFLNNLKNNPEISEDE